MTLRLELSDDLADKLHKASSASRTPPAEMATDLLRQKLDELPSGDADQNGATPVSFEGPFSGEDEGSLGPVGVAAKIVLDCMASVPDEIMDQMPKDGAAEHDHYIYGWPKRGQ